jgi:hypothetical protein
VQEVRVKLLSIYLNDHLAAGAAGIALARRCASENRGTELGEYLDRLGAELSEEREQLLELMRALGVRPQRWKVALVAVAERLGRLKLNGRLLGYSPLSRVVELEGLAVGIEARGCLWQSLAAIAPDDARIRPLLSSLIERADRQRHEIEPHRLAAVRRAFAPGAEPVAAQPAPASLH